jgi:hypothetical protein
VEITTDRLEPCLRRRKREISGKSATESMEKKANNHDDVSPASQRSALDFRRVGALLLELSVSRELFA